MEVCKRTRVDRLEDPSTQLQYLRSKWDACFHAFTNARGVNVPIFHISWASRNLALDVVYIFLHRNSPHDFKHDPPTSKLRLPPYTLRNGTLRMERLPVMGASSAEMDRRSNSSYFLIHGDHWSDFFNRCIGRTWRNGVDESANGLLEKLSSATHPVPSCIHALDGINRSDDCNQQGHRRGRFQLLQTGFDLHGDRERIHIFQKKRKAGRYQNH